MPFQITDTRTVNINQYVKAFKRSVKLLQYEQFYDRAKDCKHIWIWALKCKISMFCIFYYMFAGQSME